MPLVISAFTHLWNPIGFPNFHVDEGHYMRRAMQVLEGLGPQESKETYDYGYDHPFFGQIFLAALLSIVNYPASLNPSVSLHSIEMLYLVPRVIMGLLAVVDTFLVYKIAETRYNRKVAFISASLFAITPLSRILRAILLDSIELPFILLSILFALYYAKLEKDNHKISPDSEKKILLLLISGIFLGLAIFTKVPVFTIIPLVGFIILKQAHRHDDGTKIRRLVHLKLLGVWFIPVVLIPLIWPVYAISVGQLGDWLNGVLYQTERQGSANLSRSLMIVTQIDPLLIIFGLLSLIYAAIKRDYFVLLWSLPYLLFLYLIGWVVHFHWSILLPLFCIAIGMMIEELRMSLSSHKLINLLPYVAAFGIAIFGVLNMVTLVSLNLNATYNQVYLLVTQELQHNDDNDDMQIHHGQVEDSRTTLIGSHRTRALIWIPKYVFNSDVIFRDTDLPNDNFTKPVLTNKFLIVADSNLLARLTSLNQLEKYLTINKLYYNTSQTIATFIDNESERYSYMNLHENYGLGPFIEARANY
jgi:dolichyl-phosphate-mannose-protein mannosyltransferase